MIRTGHIGRYELYAIVVIAAVADMFLTFPQQFVIYGMSAGWMIPLLSMIISLVIWSWIGPVLVKLPGYDLLSLSQRFLGRWGLMFVVFLITLLLLVDMASTFRIFAETVITTVLPRTPISMVAIPFMLVVAYYAYVGVEGMSRVAWLLSPWLLLGLLSLLLLNINWMHLQYILPLWGKGIPALLVNGWVVTGVFKNILFLTILSSKLRDAREIVKIGYWSILTVGLIYTLVTLVFLMVFPPAAAIRSPFPLYQLARLIYIGRFIQRLESAFAFIWVAMILLKIAFKLWVVSYITATFWKMPVNRPLVFPLAMLIYALSFIPRNFMEMLLVNTGLSLRWKWTVDILVPLVILLWVRLRNRKGEIQNGQTT